MTKFRISLSIIITTYQRNHWLQECLQSVLNSISAYQASGGTDLLEVIVCDDDADQNAFPIAEWRKDFNAHNANFHYQVNSKNLGDYFNRNAGIQLASGKWVKFIDDDDLVYEWAISFMIEKLSAAENANTVIFYLRDNFRHLKFPVVLKDKEIFSFHYNQHGLFHCSLVSAAFLRADLVKCGGFKFKRFYGDFQIFHEMANKGCFYIFPIELGWYRQHENQESGNNRRMVMVRFNYLVYSYQFFKSHGYYDKAIIQQLLNDCVAYIRQAAKRADFRLLVKAAKLYFIIRKGQSSSTQFTSDQVGWNAFYQRQMQFNNNVLVEKVLHEGDQAI